MNSVKFQKIKLQEAYDLIFKPNYIGEGDRSLYPCVGGYSQSWATLWGLF